ncbi:MAG: hypothetical protein LKM32_16070 [Chiayiivirga sp.]|jgi:hypothetical protein|uniref:hypothetical protein n=1 Tax=Chiayiivirga sp. TaxID=2041042 RepID=UPI0025C0DAEC|nr:hypothetical protein [Chiayiivirga sp.]MCI1710429.1 hypothetical protein [Chiayiivirga sp.]MCI1730824.1 hypothetical protein [Chiayiivirga sp.]
MKASMNPISDGELLLYHYRDGLDAERNSEIEDALFYDAELRLRLAALREALGRVGEAWPSDEPDAGLEARVWGRLAPALPPRRASRSPLTRLLGWIEPLRPAPLAFAGLLIATLGIGYLIGQRSVAPATNEQALLAPDASSRVLGAYLAAHLQQTERALLVAANSPQESAAARDLATHLLESHRLYAAAAERAGKPALARFLRELDPVLIELANEQDAIAPALGEEIRRRDLAFKTRAAAALARREFGTQTRSL